MIKINWHGNDGRCYPIPGKIYSVDCGICGATMDVQRDVFMATSFVESLQGHKHYCDAFTCPNLEEEWHKIIHQLKLGVYMAKINNDQNVDKTQSEIGNEITNILNKVTFLTVFMERWFPNDYPRYIAKWYKQKDQTNWTLMNNLQAQKVFRVTGLDSNAIKLEARQKARALGITFVENIDE